MEFEKDAPVSDDERRLAETKKLTIQPAHDNIEPEDISDSDIANQHINGQPIGNVTNDIEQNAPILVAAEHTIRPADEKQPHKQSALMIIIIAGIGIIVIGVSLFAILALTK